MENEQKPDQGRIEIRITDNGQMVPTVEGLSPFMVPTLLRKFANAVEADLTRAQ